jgi:acetyl esterase/lipase
LPAPDLANVRYGPAERNVFDLWRAPTARPAPLVLFFHGGAFLGGDKRGISRPFLAALLKAGVSVAAINYRLSSTAPYPAPMLDSARALQFLRLHAAEYNIDPTRVASTGGSAGGGISGWLAFHDNLARPDAADPVERQSTRLTCIAVDNAQTSHDARFIMELFNTKEVHPALLQLFGMQSVQDLDNPKFDPLLKDSSPINLVTADDPPAMYVYNQRSAPLPPNSSAKTHIHHAAFGFVLKKKLDALGVECVVRTREEYAPGAFEAASLQDKLDFLLKHLQPKTPAK